jgi:hypothetical protein
MRVTGGATGNDFGIRNFDFGIILSKSEFSELMNFSFPDIQRSVKSEIEIPNSEIKNLSLRLQNEQESRILYLRLQA